MTIAQYKANMIRGFTLIELMISVAIIGVIAAVAYPTYVDYIAEGGRAEGLSALMHLSNLQEQYYMDNRAYAEDMTLLGLAADPFVTNGGLYKLDSTGTDSFTIVATALGAQASRDSACTTIELTDTGAKTPSECW